jgi:hypothetical protein
MYTIRTQCIVCKTPLDSVYFETDIQTYVAHYAIETPSSSAHGIPFNICKCSACSTVQLKYLGDLSEIYKINHADSTGKTMQELHQQTTAMILRNKQNIKNIMEIGSSVGFLADLILDKLDVEYYIIEPSYKGTYRANKHIIQNFYEYVDDSELLANTLIISHVFEHFYNPSEILEKIYQNQNIEHFYLVWPNLEHYMQNNILHVLNTEHTYYIDNTFLINLMSVYGFTLVEREDYKGHSVLFYFRRNTTKQLDFSQPTTFSFKNTIVPLDSFYSKIRNTVEKWNTYIQENANKKVYIWPASIHCLYLLQFSLSDQITGFLDNSPNKINKYMYGYNIPIYSFRDILQRNEPDTIILINGGVFNTDIEAECKKSTNIQFIFAE